MLLLEIWFLILKFNLSTQIILYPGDIQNVMIYKLLVFVLLTFTLLGLGLRIGYGLDPRVGYVYSWGVPQCFLLSFQCPNIASFSAAQGLTLGYFNWNEEFGQRILNSIFWPLFLFPLTNESVNIQDICLDFDFR